MSIDPVVERDRLTRRRLLAAAGGHARPGSFTARWWDGAGYVPCLLVRASGRRLRVVETHGGVLLLPGSAGRARKVLHDWRRTPMGAPATEVTTESDARAHAIVTDTAAAPLRLAWAPVVVPTPASLPDVVHIDQDVDVRVCAVARCGGLRVVPAPGEWAEPAACPCCGVAA